MMPEGMKLSTQADSAPRRRSIAPERMTRQMRVTLPVELDERLRALGDRYGVAVGTIARASIEAGVKAVSEQLRRAARAATRADGEREHGPGADRVGEGSE